jgi:hypothetical protein
MYKVFIFLIFPLTIYSQDTLMKIIVLDDIVISEEKNGFSVNDFISYVKNDTTFYKAFKHLRFFQHNFKSELNIFNKKNEKIASLNKEGVHYSDSISAYISYHTVTHAGKIFKRNGNYRFYTPKAFDEVFFPKDTFAVSLNISKEKSVSKESQNMRDAKTIGFSIGNDNVEQNKGGVKKKLAIFDIDMQQYYDYVISDTLYNNYPCYVFSVNVKDSISEKMKEKVLIRRIVSYFDKDNLNVIFREYIFKYNNWFIELDINVVVHMDYVNSIHVPIKVEYKGFWDVIFFKAEKADFSLILSDYIID